MSGPAEHEPQPVRTGEASQVEVFPVIHKDLFEREAYGREEYGGPLVTNDGRDNDWDAYQEALDLVVYLRKGLLEREAEKERVRHLEDEIALLRAMVRDRDAKIAGDANIIKLLWERLEESDGPLPR